MPNHYHSRTPSHDIASRKGPAPCPRASGKEGDYENHQKLFYSQVINTLDDMEVVSPMQEGDYMEEELE